MESVYKNLYISPSKDHWSRDNELKEWTAEEVEKFIKSHCNGIDVKRPVGKRILCKEFTPPEKIGSIFMPGQTIDMLGDNLYIGLVLDFGPEAFQDKELFPMGPYAYRGDWIMYDAFERRRITIEGDIKLFNIYDDKIIAKIKDPSFVKNTPR